MPEWRSTARKWLLLAAIALHALLCTIPWFLPSIFQRRRYIAIYIAPFALGFLLWGRRRLLDSWVALDARVAVDVVAVACSAVRLAGPVIPPSGHMLFFVYTLLTTASSGYRAVVTVLIAEATLIKLFVWYDLASWAFGVLSGLALGGVYFALPGSLGLRGDTTASPLAEANPVRRDASRQD